MPGESGAVQKDKLVLAGESRLAGGSRIRETNRINSPGSGTKPGVPNPQSENQGHAGARGQSDVKRFAPLFGFDDRSLPFENGHLNALSFGFGFAKR